MYTKWKVHLPGKAELIPPHGHLSKRRLGKTVKGDQYYSLLLAFPTCHHLSTPLIHTNPSVDMKRKWRLTHAGHSELCLEIVSRTSALWRPDSELRKIHGRHVTYHFKDAMWRNLTKHNASKHNPSRVSLCIFSHNRLSFVSGRRTIEAQVRPLLLKF